MKVSFGEFQAKVLKGERQELCYPAEDACVEAIEMARVLRGMARQSLGLGWTLDDVAELAMALED